MSQARQGGALTPNPVPGQRSVRASTCAAKAWGLPQGWLSACGAYGGEGLKEEASEGLSPLSHRGTESENKERRQTGSHLVWLMLKLTSTGLWLFSLKQQAPKHRKKQYSEKSKMIPLSREGQKGRWLIGGTPSPLPRGLGKTRAKMPVPHDLPSTSTLSYHRPSRRCSGQGTRGPRRRLSGCQGAS